MGLLELDEMTDFIKDIESLTEYAVTQTEIKAKIIAQPIFEQTGLKAKWLQNAYESI
jgi:hypothetical protein